MSTKPYSHTELSALSSSYDFRDASFVKPAVGYLPKTYTGPERLEALSRIAVGVKFERKKREAYLTRYLRGVGPQGRERFFQDPVETESFTISSSFKMFAKDALERIIPGRLVDPIYFDKTKGVSAELVHQNQLGNWDTTVLDADMRALQQSSQLLGVNASCVGSYDAQHPKTSYKWHYMETPEGGSLLICDRVRPEADYMIDGTQVDVIKRSSFFVMPNSQEGEALDLLNSIATSKAPDQGLQNEVGLRVIEPAITRFKRSGVIDPAIFPIEALFFAMIRHRSE